jgi:glutaredoxin
MVAIDLLDEAEKERARDELGKVNPSKSYPTVVIDERYAVLGFQEDELKGRLGL